MIAAQSAINALHNQRSLPPLRNPLQVRFADSGVNSSDRGQTNAENKLFVGGVPPGCGDKELRALFNTYGEVLDVYIWASKASQEGQRGCAFVRYSTPQSCAMAIEALHGKYAMKTGELPLVVRYADPPKSQRGSGAYGSGRFPAGWPQAPPSWPAGPPPIGWAGMGWGMPGGGMGMPGAYPPWPMPPMGGQPGVPNPYAYYGTGQFGSQPGGGPGGVPAQQQAGAGTPPGYGAMPPPPPPGTMGGAAGGAQPPLPPPAPQQATHAWSEHLTPEGLRYYYNTATGTSSWDRPQELSQQGQRVGTVPPLPPLPQAGAASTGQPATPTVSQAGGVEQAMEAMSALQIGGGSNGGAAYSPPPSSTATSGGGGYAMAGGAGNGLGLGGGLGLSMPAANGAGTIESLVGGAGGENGGATNVLIAEWPGTTSDLQTMFSRYGNITFCDADASSGSARVVFDSSLSARHAVEMVNGQMVGEKQLLVSLTAGY